MGRKNADKALFDAIEAILFEEGVDEVFNMLLTYDYSEVIANLPKEGYILSAMSEEERFLALLAGACYEIEGGGEIGEFAQLLSDSYFESIEVLKPASITEEPYYKLLQKVPNFKSKGIEFGMRKYEAFQPFLSKRRRFCSDFEITPKPSIACFPTSVSYPALSSNGEIWMSLIPHEINSMKEDFDLFEGNVLIYGLGLGYAAFEASRKEEVSKVTVIEKDPVILSFFKEHILPLFPNKDKVELIEGDAIDFAEEHKDRAYDVLFADLWHTGEDGLRIYASLKRNEGAAKTNRYWVEEEMLIYFRRLYLRQLAYDLTGEIEFLEDIAPSPYAKDLEKADKCERSNRSIKECLAEENLKDELLRIIL